jgi:hypothetical protein
MYIQDWNDDNSLHDPLSLFNALISAANGSRGDSSGVIRSGEAL